jgi:hypothetical protein
MKWWQFRLGYIDLRDEVASFSVRFSNYAARIQEGDTKVRSVLD